VRRAYARSSLEGQQELAEQRVQSLLLGGGQGRDHLDLAIDLRVDGLVDPDR